MSKQNKPHELTPELRFPSFRGNTGWATKPLGSLTTPITERVGDSDCVPYTVTSGEGLISQDDKYGRTIAGKSLKSYYKLEHNDFAFNKSATKLFPQGYIARYQDEDDAAVPNSIFTCFRISGDELDAAYLDYLFQGNLHGRWLRHYITVGARAHGALNISDDDLYALPVPIPQGEQTKAEQQEIADCLGSLDAWIAAERRKLSALHDHKRGLMQQLFPPLGQTHPPRRFPEFHNSRAWQPVVVDKMAKVQSGGTPSKSNPDYWGGTIPWVSAKDMKSVRLADTEDHVTDLAIADGAKEVPAGTVLILTRGMTLLKDVPVCLIQRPMTYNQDVKALLPRKGVVSEFLTYLLLASKASIRALVDTAGHGTGRLNTDDLKGLELSKPEPEEQRRIADCLTALDDRITAQAAKLDALATHKRGLMQQLLPLPETFREART
ncbi:MAG: restriction endonuclease subunit S [Planctomycetota bacterium]